MKAGWNLKEEEFYCYSIVAFKPTQMPLPLAIRIQGGKENYCCHYDYSNFHFQGFFQV